VGIDPEVAPGDGLAEDGMEIRRIHPYRATKHYLCPGCNQDIVPGLAHLVVVPLDEPDLRRHWHTPCWMHRHRRRPGRIV
jgi:hypothetical protein